MVYVGGLPSQDSDATPDGYPFASNTKRSTPPLLSMQQNGRQCRTHSALVRIGSHGFAMRVSGQDSHTCPGRLHVQVVAVIRKLAHPGPEKVCSFRTGATLLDHELQELGLQP